MTLPERLDQSLFSGPTTGVPITNVHPEHLRACACSFFLPVSDALEGQD